MKIKSKKKVKKKGWSWLIAIIMLVGMSTGCSTDESKIKTDAKVVTAAADTAKAETPKAEVKPSDTLKNIDESNKKISTTKDPVILKQELNDTLGDGEILNDVIVDGKHITLNVNLGVKDSVITLEDLAESRYSSLSDDLLLNEYWTKITVNFIEVCNISMDTKDAVNEGNGRYFKAIEISKNSKK
ncbi:hypothetical protein LGL55_05735 [Clostridium tagluense]|uniref:hypothetical protein n=1 Tax=Clostridium tagluense TaxID=360422 RepID=UPI001CF4ECF0|nr:hypothetical protein [Clostridium tagluense]MCB2310623.1 hypothetical protein [Clostridium tagluense]MCB2315646.1 hypothetical protein [Clostridium tagluense]MCB2320500.1 hypothetical protein [Clostridium tagluense]MCB2325217.1 hypothetical protein [Clostridium tagluense]MCB2330069.1 hypothetical protein [Clostridium tagluense]